MKKFIKNSYLFLILFILIIAKNYVLGFFTRLPEPVIKDSYVETLEAEIANINLIKNNNYKNNFYYAKVLYLNPYKPGYINILIDSENIKTGDLVISDSALLGTIANVKNKQAEVKTLYAEDFLLQVSINNCYGILKNDKIETIDNYCPIKIGDEVYSAQSFLQDKILVGTIQDIIKDKNKVSNTYVLKPLKNFSNLNYLIVIGGF